MMNKTIFAACLAGLCALSIAHAESPEKQGLAIAQEVEHRDSGWGDAEVSMQMVLRNRQGDESTRAIRLKILEVSGDGDKSLTIFDNPKDIKGTSFLSFSHIIKADDQWLYLPALKRVKRISSINKSGPFMGSQFSYEDLASFEVAKYHYKYLHDEMLDGIDTFVVENYPNYEFSGYTHQLVWIDKARYIPLKVEYYDRKGALLKTQHFNEYRIYLGQYWRAHRQIMENHQSGKITLLKLEEYKFQAGLGVRDFDRNALRRVR